MDQYAELLLAENDRQNLVSKASVADLWQRHLIDSAQLLTFGLSGGRWLDIGSGPGLPGIVLAILGVEEITLVEPRRLRTDFLEQCVVDLGLTNVSIVTGKVERLQDRFDVITARAVASLDKLLAMSSHLVKENGRWVLPKGRSAAKELEEARVTWQGDFRLEASLTDPEARILVASGVKRKAGRG
jgi:16S rRNA (guanine527-N7)-methyltransferase